MGKLKSAARTSEFWVGLVSVLGSFAAHAGLIPQGTWDRFLDPALVYVGARITSKVAKAQIK